MRAGPAGFTGEQAGSTDLVILKPDIHVNGTVKHLFHVKSFVFVKWMLPSHLYSDLFIVPSFILPACLLLLHHFALISIEMRLCLGYF